ncbi:MAG TPA: VCBS repeat-containing protein, partial [Myxococcota bacterium]|nr:VCBS repeat-containing protein [Myxococcota bacterium]
IAAGDVTGDSKVDLVVTRYTGTLAYILRGAGDGSFTVVQQVTVGATPSGVVLTNLNGDPNLDIVTISPTDKTLSVLLGQGNATFAAAVNYASGNGPAALVAADLNADGRMDLVVANDTEGVVSVFKGKTPAGTLTMPAITYAAGTAPTGLVARDLNSDGVPDLAVTNLGTHSVSILLGAGNATFLAPVSYDVLLAPRWITHGDVNGDGNVDLITACSESNSVVVLYGQGDGTFYVRPYFTTMNPIGLAAGDMDSNGVPDMVTINGSDTLSVMLGSSCAH